MPNLYLKILSFTLLLFVSVGAFAKNDVVVTIKPLHSVTLFLLQGVDTPKLLMSGLQSPHHFHLKPSQAKLLRQAKLIVWVGENIESSLANLLTKINTDKQIHFFEHNPKKQNHHSNQHYWLDPLLVLGFAKALSLKLQKIYPLKKQLINNNLLLLTKKLQALNVKISTQLSNKKIRFVSIHNDLKYFAKRYKLTQVATLQTSDHQKPSLKAVLKIKKLLQKAADICIVSSGVVPSKWVKIINSGNNKSITIDTLGTNLVGEKELYFLLLTQLSQQLISCNNVVGTQR